MTNNIIVLEEDLSEKDIDDKNMMSWITTNHTWGTCYNGIPNFQTFCVFSLFPPQNKKSWIYPGWLGLAGGQNSTKKNIVLNKNTKMIRMV